MFTKILIANRGEIACRVAKTARRLGIQTVAVFSDADAGAKHVAACDQAAHIGAAPARESYLVADKILAVAKATGAQAIHPGYGFLSESAGFAEACVNAGFAFIGPPASAIAAMGLKAKAKAHIERAGVPLVPGYHDADQDPTLLAREAGRIGYPVLIKASAGGGGKGMRVVEERHDFHSALESCKREALSAFGDDAVLIEKYLQRPRHIEVQVFADTKGGCVYLFERDCSVQRRHQKVLEEAPAPGMTDSRRRAMGEAAVAAAKAVGYVGAGTVEFIVEGDRFYFMEMNTRLQVEHPVTELITGLDLVEWQLRIASGEALPKTQAELASHGHALEARVYAESPEKGFLPSTGTLTHLRFPPHVEFEVTSQLRVDSGVRQGDGITAFYDPMIAKVIVWGETRAHALARMSEALARTQVVGVATNVAFLQRLVESGPFSAAELDTGLIARHHDVLLPPPRSPSEAEVALAAAALLEDDAQQITSDPWSTRSGFRLNQSANRSLDFGIAKVDVIYARDAVYLGSRPARVRRSGVDYEIDLADENIRGTVVREGRGFRVFAEGRSIHLELVERTAAEDDEGHSDNLVAPMPGKIVAIVAMTNTALKRGTPLLIMEAMKMELVIAAACDGLVARFLCAPGDQVAEGTRLVEFKPAEGGPA